MNIAHLFWLAGYSKNPNIMLNFFFIAGEFGSSVLEDLSFCRCACAKTETMTEALIVAW